MTMPTQGRSVRRVKRDLLAVTHEVERFAAQTTVLLLLVGLVATAALVLSIIGLST
ncbi:MAG TPA: hypothetical protein VFH54_06030 [Mycobacteriales bacterium]|nr:hypothetical protein [Mycobacteriales bacterium]